MTPYFIIYNIYYLLHMPVGDEIKKSLWKSSEKLRGQVESSEYKHIVLGLLFLRDASIRFDKYQSTIEEKYEPKNEEEKEKLLKKQLTSESAFYIPKEARWENIGQSDKNMNQTLDDAMQEIMDENPRLDGRLPKRYQQANVKPDSLRHIYDEFSKIDVSSDENTDDDFVGRIYEYFIRQFAIETAQGSGEFYTPQDVVELLIESLQPLEGRIFDPCAGTGGMFVQTYEHANKTDGYRGKDMDFYGQEINNASISLAEMNMFLRNMSDAVTLKEGDSLLNDRITEDLDENSLGANKVISNPPFNYTYNKKDIDDDDPRFPYGLPNKQNANYAFVQHMLYHTKDGGTVGTVMANGALSNNSDRDIRKGLVEDDLVDVIITLPSKLFYTVSIPVSIFIFSKGKGKNNPNHRNRSGETLFIDASDMYEKKSRSEHRLKNEYINKISNTIQKYRGELDTNINAEDYNIDNFCSVAKIKEIKNKEYNFNPGRYIYYDTNTEYTPLKVRLPELQGQLESKFKQNKELESEIMTQLDNLTQDNKKGDLKNE